MSEKEPKVGFLENPLKRVGQEWNSSRWTTKAVLIGLGLLVVI